MSRSKSVYILKKESRGLLYYEIEVTMKFQ